MDADHRVHMTARVADAGAPPPRPAAPPGRDSTSLLVAEEIVVEYHLGRGELDQAGEAIQRMKELRPSDPWNLTFEGYLAALRGDEETARHFLAELDELTRHGNRTVFMAGFVHFALGEMDAFYMRMSQALQLHDLPLLQLMYSPLFAAARGKLRFRALLEAQRALHESQSASDGDNFRP